MNISSFKRSGWIGAMLSVSALILCTSVMAQPPGGPRGPGGPGGPRGPEGPGGPRGGAGAIGMGMLLRLESVRDELDITGEQALALKDKADDFRAEMREKFGEQMRNRQRGPKGERGPQGERGPRGERSPKGERGAGPNQEMRDSMREMQSKVEAGLQEILTTSQLERLKEIHVQAMIQMAGPRALAHGPLAEELGITDEQREEMREAGRAAMEEIREKARENFETLRAEAHEQVFAVLSSEQREKLSQLQGEPMELDLPHRGRRGPGGPEGEARGPGKKGKGNKAKGKDGSGKRRGQRRGPGAERPAPDA